MVQPRILARVNRDALIGRDADVRQIVRHASGIDDVRALVLAAQPDAGASEILRHAYDELFARRGQPIPIHFAFKPSDTTPVDVARRFFQTFLQQFVAYRRVDPSLCEARLTPNDLLERTLPADYELISGLIESFQREASEPENLTTFCLSLPQRAAAAGRQVFPLIDCLKLKPFREEIRFVHEVVSSCERSGCSFVLAGLRRQAGDLIHGFDNGENSTHSIMRVDRLSDADATRVVDALARGCGIETEDSTGDLIVQQLNASPVLIGELLATAREKDLGLTSFRACQRLYVDELMGGSIKRYFDRIVQMAAPNRQSRRTLLQLLYESATSESAKTSLWSWKKRLGLAAPEFERVIDVMHAWELVNAGGAFIEVNTQWQVWVDYLRAEYRLEGTVGSRAQIVAATLLETLKRAPQTMARKYRREAALDLDDVVARFDCQKVPASLMHYDRFAASYRGETDEVIADGLDHETELVELPQVVQTTACNAYSATFACDSERCIVAHGFEAGEYADENEVVWLCAQIDSKLEANRELTDDWCNRLALFAGESGLARFQIWLVTKEGFSATASELLNERGAFGSSHRQFDLLRARIQANGQTPEQSADEFEMVIPMSADTELIAARTAEQIARRVNFGPEAINQIKTAVVEACINAAEHSLSPDRKIYQRFVVEDDRLVITVASRGVLPMRVDNGSGAIDQGNGNGRRGWGLKLIRTLMDEVEFERVDDGTQLKMTKYLK
jgi:serine/threonine-protein kinase RsbW